jgi:hypothetical protein
MLKWVKWLFWDPRGRECFMYSQNSPWQGVNHMIDERKICCSNNCETRMNMEKECLQIHYQIRI